MFDALRRIPIKSRKSVAGGLLYAAVLAGLFGLLLTLGFLENTEESCTGRLWNKKCTEVAIPLADRIGYLLVAIGLGLFALVCTLVAVRLYTMADNLKRYLAILTGIESLSVARIADITGSQPSVVRDEIQNLIDSGEIDDLYIDYSADQVISRKYIPKTSHKTVVKCLECGGKNDVIVGITRVCAFCRQPLVLPAG